MARPNLWHAAVRLVSRPANRLSRNFRRRIFPVALPDSAIRSSGVSQQHRVVRADDFSFRAWYFFAGSANCALSDAGRHTLRSTLLHGADAHRAEVRHGSRALAGHVSCVHATTGARLVALFHLATF